MGMEERGSVQCTKCATDNGRIERVAMPYVLKYLVSELAVMNIKMTFDVA
jgi:DNA-directed RNA polymerase beta subunit